MICWGSRRKPATPVAADTEDAYTAGGPHIGNAWPNSLAGNSLRVVRR